MSRGFNVQRAKDLELLYNTNQLPPEMRADYELVRPQIKQQLEDGERSSPWYVQPIIWVPPFAAFVGGCLLIWVVRGFRP